MSSLAIRLEGPMQAWGTTSRFTERDSGQDPSKSGVVGLLCTCLGRGRKDNVADLAGLRMAVRVDREGKLQNDFHTVMETSRASGATGGMVVSNRQYLADGCFVVFLEGEESLLAQVLDGLNNPHWLPFLGRKSFPPSSPLLLDRSVSPDGLESRLSAVPWMGRWWDRDKMDKFRAVVECGREEGEERMDVPLSFSPRRYSVRYVKTIWLRADQLTKGGEDHVSVKA
ncbi:MAG TPA: type I-E CRISPR-associated protein Cas5/CasD [Methanomassiliicoccales archaeon]|jgi:CRISPR system Cascade subunit CasD